MVKYNAPELGIGACAIMYYMNDKVTLAMNEIVHKIDEYT
jgi:hypothetical protein